MKKLILSAFMMVLLSACKENCKVCGIELKEGDKKTYETEQYYIVFEIESIDNHYNPVWKLKEIVNKQQTEEQED